MAFYEPWRVAKSLLKLVDQINRACPGRSKGVDGHIGDKAHQARNSDHNPQIWDGKHGIVTAYDITHDPARGMDMFKLAEALRKSKDPRIKYLIRNRQIWNPSISNSWRPASGHEKHIHISVKGAPKFYDDDRPWKLPDFLPDSTSTPTMDRPVLRRGSKGGDVTYLQVLLDVRPADGKFGPRTEAAVIEFQREQELEADGVVGLYTWETLLETKGK